MSSSSDIRDWHWPGPERFLCSSNPNYIQLNVINATLASDIMWWARALEQADLEKMVQNCFIVGLYYIQEESKENTGKIFSLGHLTKLTITSGTPIMMIGMARVITDRVTFGYLTDVFVLPEYQGKGLGRWMIECLNEVVKDWQALRGFWIIAGSPDSARLYETSLGAKPAGVYRSTPNDLVLLEKPGPANPHGH